MFKNFSAQAKLALLGYAILYAVLILSIFKSSNDKSNNDGINPEYRRYIIITMIVYSLFIIISILISVYTINCLTMGSTKGGPICEIISWVKSIVIFFPAIVFAIFSLLSINTEKSNFMSSNMMKPNDMRPGVNVAMDPTNMSNTTVISGGTNNNSIIGDTIGDPINISQGTNNTSELLMP
jgi:nitrogen fixation/metabolism regulation signal transduction histidine kinase